MSSRNSNSSFKKGECADCKKGTAAKKLLLSLLTGVSMEIGLWGQGADRMRCLEHEQRLRDIEGCRTELTYFLFHKESQLLSDADAKQSAYKAASALAKASNDLHRHEVHCMICKTGRGAQDQV
jgi:hypothetical protein